VGSDFLPILVLKINTRTVNKIPQTWSHSRSQTTAENKKKTHRETRRPGGLGAAMSGKTRRAEAACHQRGGAVATKERRGRTAGEESRCIIVGGATAGVGGEEEVKNRAWEGSQLKKHS